MTTPRYTTATASGLLVANPLVEQPAVTFAQLPSAASAAGRPAYRVTDIGPAGYGSLWISNGVRWSPLGGRLVLKTLGAPLSGITNTPETIAIQALLPAGSWQVNDNLRFWYNPTKSGTTDVCVRGFRIGTAGTVADTQVETGNIIGAGNQTAGTITDLKLVSATTVQKVGQGSASLGTYAIQGAVAPAAVTISSAATNALYVTLTLKSSNTNDTVGLQSAQIELITP